VLTLAVGPTIAPAVQWQNLSTKQGMQGSWIKLAYFLKHLKLPKNQARRDYLIGTNAWRVGARRGSKLQNPGDWMQRPGSRGGIAPIFIKKEKLEEVFLKYYAK